MTTVRAVLPFLLLVGALAAVARDARADVPPPPRDPVVVRPVTVPAACWGRWGCAPRPCAYRLELEAGPAWQSLNDVAIPGDVGTRFALDGLTGPGPFFSGRATLDWQINPRHGVRLVAAPLEFSGTGRLDAPVQFAGVAYAAGVDTRATYRFDSYRLTYRYTLYQDPCWALRVGATLKVRSAEIALEQGALSSRKTDLGLVPLLHAEAEVRFFPRWSLCATVDGLAAPQGRAIDAALKLRHDLDARWSVALGVRTIEGGADNDEVYTFAWLHYAMLSVAVRF